MIVKAHCTSSGGEVRFSLGKHLWEKSDDDDLLWFATRKDFKDFLKNKEGLIFYAKFKGELPLPKAGDRSLDDDVSFNKDGSFRVGCMHFDRKNAAKLRAWAYGRKK